MENLVYCYSFVVGGQCPKTEYLIQKFFFEFIKWAFSKFGVVYYFKAVSMIFEVCKRLACECRKKVTDFDLQKNGKLVNMS